jgi:pimeloyl-ACP methyl ester carboxylesterase
MPSISSLDGTRISYQEIGSGPPLVLIPGINLDHAVWSTCIARLQGEFRVIALDLRGHGDSDKPAGGYSYATLAADVAALIGRLQVEDAVVVGWSFGGAVALRYAVEARTPPSGLVLVAAAVPRVVVADDWPRGISVEDAAAAIDRELSVEWPSARRAVLERMFVEAPDRQTLDWLWSLSIQTPPWVGVACRRTLYTEDLRAALPSLAVRTLIVHGMEDRIVPVASAEFAHAAIPDSRLVPLEDCGHAPPLEQPRVFNALLQEFLREVHRN